MLPETPPTAVQRVALVASSGRDLADLTDPLVARLLNLRQRPICLATDLDPATARDLAARGAEVSQFVLPPGGLNFVADFRARRQASAALKAIRPHTVLAYDLDAAAGMAPLVRRAGCHRLVAALASIGAQESGGSIAFAPRAERQWRQLMPVASGFVVANTTEVRLLRGLEFYTGVPIEVAPQRGIDLDTWRPVQLPPQTGGILFVTDAASLTLDDLRTLADAMARVVKEAPHASVSLAGTLAPTVDRAAALEAIRKSPQTAFEDHTGDLAATITGGHVYLHPHSHPGVTGALLTALAIGRPVVATDVSGTRETVDQVVNGILAKPGDPRALADAMLGIVRRADILQTLADASRRKAERRFDATTVNAALLGALGVPLSLGSAA